MDTDSPVLLTGSTSSIRASKKATCRTAAAAAGLTISEVWARIFSSMSP